jgi:hypothetical protein
MNMEVKIVTKSPAGFARKRLGTNAHVSIKASPPINSTRKNRTFRAIREYVTTGTILREVLSSPTGNIRFFLHYVRKSVRWVHIWYGHMRDICENAAFSHI